MGFLRALKGLRHFPAQMRRLKDELAEFTCLLNQVLPPELRGQVLEDRWAVKKPECEPLDLRPPRTFCEKIQALKLMAGTPLLSRLADKYAVREWVAETVGERYLIPLVGVWSSVGEIGFDSLPRRFVLKATHGSHWNIVVKDRSRLDVHAAKVEMAKWLRTNYAFKSRFQMQYASIPPRILAEEYLENAAGELYDYKFWCFKGEVRYIQFMSGRESDLRTVFFDTDWRAQPFTYNRKMLAGALPPKPENLGEMIDVATRLSAGFEFVRVDLYRLDDGTVKFGEMTFTPANGFGNWNPSEWDEKIGALFDVRPGNRMEGEPA